MFAWDLFIVQRIAGGAWINFVGGLRLHLVR